MAVNPGSCRIRTITIDGAPFPSTAIVDIRVTESLMRSFQTCEMIIVDNYNLVNEFNGGLYGGEDVELVFDDAQSGGVYEFSGKLHSISGADTISNQRTAVYTINCVGHSYYGNMVNGKVQMSLRNITGSDAIQRIHDEYLRCPDAELIVKPSKGFLGEEEPFIISNLTPFQAINLIRTRLSSDQYPSGAFCYYRDNESYHLKQLEDMFDNLQAQEYFTQDSTMGKSIKDYNYQGRVFIAFQSGTSFLGPGGKSAPLTSFNVDKKVQTNYVNFGEGYSQGRLSAPTTEGIEGDVNFTNDEATTQYARQYKLFPGDPRLNKIDPVQEKSNEEQYYANILRSGPGFTAVVPLDGGIRTTVGKGIYADISAPVGGGSSVSKNDLEGLYLVVNLKHHLRLMTTEVPMATTTMECIRGGFN